jgi:hypothetical protein
MGLTEVKVSGWQRRVKTVLVGLGRTEMEVWGLR